MAIEAPTLLDALKGVLRSAKTLGSATHQAGQTGYHAYRAGASKVPSFMFSAPYALSQAVPAATSKFYQSGGLRALGNLGLAATTAYGGKKLYDTLRERYAPTRSQGPINPWQHTF